MAEPYPVSISISVQWSEMDALGHVNNARFFTWFESARIALFERIGVATTGPAGFGPILATTSCDFLRPVVYPATLRVGVRVSRVGETSIGMEYEVRDAAGLDEPYARGTSVAVIIDYRTMKKSRVPDDVRAAITAL
jgi:acyl-CoA thioester hydrolase